MSVPEPPMSLDNSCTVIYENTLYSYSPAGFLALRLEEGAEWQTLASGEVVTGATCVGTTPPDAAQAGFFVVGGQSESSDYNGLQKFTYSTGEWTRILTTAEVTRNRRWHAATYIQANDAILVYAGTTDGTAAPSSQTFVIGASEPYETRGAVGGATGAPPPGVSPILLQWSVADAVLLGGDAANNKVWLFNPTAGWRDFSTTLEQPIKDTSIVRAVVVDGADGSKSLLEFDMTISPNSVSRVVLQTAEGGPVFNSAPVSRRAASSVDALTRRELTLIDWPEYNSTLAPLETRSNYAMAVSPENRVVFSGGNAEHPLAIFDVNENSWEEPGGVFVEDQQRLRVSSTTSSEAASSTATSESALSVTSSVISSIASTSTEPASTTAEALSTSASATSTGTSAPIAGGDEDESSGLGTGAVLGITLGTILGFLAILVVALLLLRRRKQRASHAESGRDGGSGEKSDAAFAKSPLPPTNWQSHRQHGSQDSFSSVAILMGHVGGQKQSMSRVPSNQDRRGSVESLRKQFKSTIGKPVLQTSNLSFAPASEDKGVAFASTVVEPRPRNGPLPTEDGIRRSSGWNRYWSGGSALQLLGFGGPPRPRSRVTSESSHYSESQNPHPRRTQDSATVPPLNFEGRAGVNRVNSGSPVVSQHPSSIPFRDGMSGKIERPVSKASSGYSSGIPESVSDMWEAADGERPWGAKRASNSAYVPSFYWGTPLAPAGAASVATVGEPSRHTPSGVSTQPQLSKAKTSSDLSWLNLGGQGRS
ncbi:hypothetical protein S40285_00644 [Stachybotrys chlorohalonatus IBT 40285]|uniref:Pre-mRNA splicing factor CLF1 n=1 Tax=Stachybotrys chlorohalonatus (strain IBT 40285) TaxID=1283841 RepID=A0A084R2N6_STAC4|nr:hypothetical protein S40285_00644 [Stachybotrys chlorohalonata IBT 40285]